MAPLYFSVALGLADDDAHPSSVRVEGDLDPLVTEAFEAAVAAAAALSSGDLEIELEAIGFVGVAGARAIARVVDRMQASGRRVTLEHAPRTVQRLLNLVHEQPDALPAASDRAERVERDGIDTFAQSLQILVADARAVSVTSAEGGRLETLFATGPLALELDQVQYDADSGPCVEAATHGRNSFVSTGEHRDLWPEVARAAERKGIRAVVSTPLTALAPGLALNMYFRDVVESEQRELVHDLVTHAAQVRSRVTP